MLLRKEGKALRKQRSVQAVGSFVIMKEDQKYMRMNRRRQERVELEMYLYAIVANIRKYYNKKQRKKLNHVIEQIANVTQLKKACNA